MTRRILTYCAFILLLPLAGAFSQEQPESKNPDTEGTEARQQKPARTGSFIDDDGDGIDDRKTTTGKAQNTTETQQRRRQRSRDCFIDTDGDGINDNRSTGVGVSSGSNKGRRWGRK